MGPMPQYSVVQVITETYHGIVNRSLCSMPGRCETFGKNFRQHFGFPEHLPLRGNSIDFLNFFFPNSKAMERESRESDD